MLVLPFLFWLLLLSLVASFVPSISCQSRPSSPVTVPSFFRSTTLTAKKCRKNKSDLPSFPISSMRFLSDDTNAMKSSLETLLVLSDKKRQAVWKEDMRKLYPFVPAAFVDKFADSVVSSFSAVAPAELKMVVQPGGLDKLKSKLESTIKKELRKNDMYAKLPLLSNEEKDKLLSNLIGYSLDLLLQDAAMVLAHPNEKLQALEEQKRQVTRFMTKRQLLWYKFRYHPVRSALVVAAGTLLLGLLYNGYKSTAAVKASEKSAIKVWALAKSLVMGLVRLVSGKGPKRRSPRRVPKRVR